MKKNTLNWGYFLGLGIVVVVSISYQLIYYNRFFPIQEGWFYNYAFDVLAGKIVYKDFYLFIQPLFVYLVTLVAYLSDFSFIAERYAGMLMNTFLLILLYTLFARASNFILAILLALATFFLYSSNPNDVILSYYQLLLVFTLSAALLMQKALEKLNVSYLFFSGIFSGLAFLSKQSTGLLLIVAFVVMLMVLRKVIVGLKIKYSLVYVYGALFPILIQYGLLAYVGALHPYFIQVFGGASSKGSLFDILFGFIERMWNEKEFIIYIILLSIFALTARYRTPLSKVKCNIYHDLNIENRPIAIYAYTFLILMVAVYTSVKWLGMISISKAVRIFAFNTSMIYLVFYAILTGILFYLLRIFLQRKINTFDIKLIVLLCTSFVVMYGHGLSGVLEVHAAIPALGVVFLILFKNRTICNSVKNTILTVALFGIIMLSSMQKTAWMYSWWGWSEGSYILSSYLSNQPLLKGFILSKKSRDILDGITYDIVNNSDGNDTIYTFPHIPVFYLLAKRKGVTFSKIHYFDVCPDWVAELDASTLEHNPPKIFVEMVFPESVWQLHEALFREHKKSGQRKIESLLQQWKLSGEYEKISTYRTNGYYYPLEVWKKTCKTKE